MANTAILSVRITGNGEDAQRAFRDVQRYADNWARNMDRNGRQAAQTVGRNVNRAASAVSNLGIAFGGLILLLPTAGAAILAASAAFAGLAAMAGAVGAVVMLGAEGIKRAAQTAVPALNALKEAVSASIEGAMIPGFQSLSTLMGDIQPQMVGLASTVGNSFSTMMQGIQTRGTGAIQSIIRSADTFVKAITPGMTDLLVGMLQFADKGAQVITRFAPKINELLSQLGTYLGSITVDDIVAAFTTLRDRAMEIWTVLKPILDGLTLMAQHAAIIFALAVALKVLQIAIVAVQAATVLWTAAQWLLNTAFLANPITWVVLAVVALVAIIVVIATKTTWFQTIWQVMCSAVMAAWNAVVSAVTTAWNWVVTAISTGIASIQGFFSGLWAAVVAVWEGIRSAAGTAWQWIQDRITAVINGIKNAFNTARDAAATVWNAIRSGADGVRGAIQWVIDKVNALINAIGNIRWPSPPSWVSDIGGALGFSGVGPDFRAVPTGVDSYLRFLPNLPNMFAAPGPSLTAAYHGSGNGWMGGNGNKPMMNVTNVNITIEGAIDPVAVGRQIEQLLAKYKVTVGGTSSRRF